MAAEMLVSKLNAEAFTKAVEKSAAGVGQETPGSSFQEALDSATVEGQEFAEKLDLGATGAAPKVSMQAVPGSGVEFQPGSTATELGKPDGSRRVLDMLSEVNKGQLQMDSLVDHVLYSGKRFSNQELLVIQAHVFHYAQMTELTVKVAEQGVSSLKTTLNTQIGSG